MQSFLVDGSRSTKWDLVEEPEEEDKKEKCRGVGVNMNEDRKNLSILVPVLITFFNSSKNSIITGHSKQQYLKKMS